MSNEKDTQELRPLEGHSYDGIDELDHQLPRWWINLFYLTILFAFGYFFYYVVGEGPSLLTEYELSKRDFDAAMYSKQSVAKVASEEELRALLKDRARIHSGHEIFESKCATCHGPQGQGGIGPNLTDDYWLHGGKMAQIASTVTNGVADKGMPPWGPILKQEELYSVVAFVKSIHGTKPAGAKAPQGELVKE